MVRKITKWHLLIPFLGDYQRHVILADLERELGVPHQTIKRYADMLVKAKILKEEEKPRNILYSLNNENRMVMNYLSSAEKIVLEESLEKAPLLKRLYEMLSSRMGDANFAVFGSSASSRIGKDMDLLAVGKGDVKKTKTLFERTYGKRVHLISMKSMPKGALYREIRKKHIIFNGFDFFIKEFWESSWKN